MYLVPWNVETLAREQAHVVIAAHPHTRVYVFGAQHHALTLTLLGAVVSESEGAPRGWTDPGEAVQLLQQSSAHSRSLLWHPRAIGLQEPEPTTAHRLASLFSGPGFFSEVGVPSSLVRARDGFDQRPDETLCLPGPVPQLLQTQLGSTACSVVDVQATMSRPYATRSSVELTGLVRPSRVPVLSPSCRGCGAGLMADGCAFCGVGPRIGSNEPRRPAHRASADTPLSLEEEAA